MLFLLLAKDVSEWQLIAHTICSHGGGALLNLANNECGLFMHHSD